MMELSETGAAFLAVMKSQAVSHPSFKGQRLDPSRLTPVDIGRLLPIALQRQNELPPSSPARQAIALVLRQANHIEFQIEAKDARTVLRLWEPSELRRREATLVAQPPDAVLKLLAGCTEEISDLSDLIAPYLSRPDGREHGSENPHTIWNPHGQLLLASLCKTPEATALSDAVRASSGNSPLLQDEFDVMLSLPLRDAAAVARCATVWPTPREDKALEPRGTYPLGHIPS